MPDQAIAVDAEGRVVEPDDPAAVAIEVHHDDGTRTYVERTPLEGEPDG